MLHLISVTALRVAFPITWLRVSIRLGTAQLGEHMGRECRGDAESAIDTGGVNRRVWCGQTFQPIPPSEESLQPITNHAALM
jgi:hypothetical protein